MIRTRSRSDFIDFIKANSSPLPDYRIGAPRLVYLPFCESTTTQPYFTAGYAFEMQHTSDPNKRHTVTIMLSRLNGAAEPEFHAVCGDTYLSGTNQGGSTAAQERMKSAAALHVKPRQSKLTKLMRDSYDIFDKDSDCHFWRAMKTTPEGAGCKHVRGVFSLLVAEGAIERTLDELTGKYTGALGATVTVATRAVSEEVLADRLEHLLGRGRKITYPVKIEGEHGGGKTTAARLIADKHFDCYEEVQGSAQIERFDFIGGMSPLGGGNFVWVDGPVTRAFRLAAEGKRVLLYIEEILRIPRRERDIFLSALSPHRGLYRLRCGRPINIRDGVAEMELVSAPVENISFLATTNNGGEYDVEQDDPAGADRWITIVYNPSQARITSILADTAKENRMPVSLAGTLVKFRELCRKLKADRLCKSLPTQRLLARVLSLATKPSRVKDELQCVIPNLVGRAPDGSLVPEQVEAVELAIESAFKA